MPKHNFKVGDLVTYKDHTNNNTYPKVTYRSSLMNT